MCLFTKGRGRVSLVPGSFLVTGPMSFPRGRVSMVPGPIGDRVFRRVGHPSAAVGTHPTGMLSCSVLL